MVFRQSNGEDLKVWPVLASIEGDIPFMTKMVNSLGHAATVACFKCALQATWVQTAKANR